MAESDHFKQSQSWRSRSRSRNHEAAHEAEEAVPVATSRTDVPAGKPQIIAKAEQLGGLVDRLRAAGSFAYDSEFIGELSYVPKLCVIQIATTREVALVDPLAEMDLRPIWELLADPGVEKIVHSGAQDLEPVVRLLGRPAANVIDTQIAAGFARMPYPISLRRLIEQLVGVRLGKGLTFTHWDQRPLSAQQVRYAADDVRYLPAAWKELWALAEPSLAWIKEECAAVTQNTPYTFDRETSYLKVRGSGSLDRKQLGVLRELTAWRDAGAREADLPPRAFLRDEVLVDIARRAPGTDEKLGNIQGIPRPVRTSHSAKILAAIAVAEPASEMPMRASEEPPLRQFQLDALYALAQSLCLARGIDPQLVLTRADVDQLAKVAAQQLPADGLRLLSGWRREVVGEALYKLLCSGGAVSLSVHEQQLGRP